MNQQIQEEACDWFVRMRDAQGGTGGAADAAAQSALLSWLRRSPDHVAAYLDVAAIWREAAHVDVDAHLDMATRLAAARNDDDITELRPLASHLVSARSTGRAYGRLAIAATVLLALGAAWFLVPAQWTAPRYATQLGELRSIKLDDGSTIELNSSSRIRVAYTERERRIELLEGQALFRAAKDPGRPFIVDAGASVRAVGTVFDVYRRSKDAVVTVVEGSVAILPPDAAGGGEGATLLTAGKQAIVERSAPIQPKPVNVSAATAWTQRQLMFEFTPLAEVVGEFNRYNARKLQVEGEALRAFKVSAIFVSTDPAVLVKFLRELPAVEVVETDASILIRSGND